MPEAVATKSSTAKQAQNKPRGPVQDRAPGQGTASSYDGVMELHRTAGNRAVASLVEPKYDRASLPPVVEEAIETPGQPLDRDFRAHMEARFGHDLGDVRLHTNSRAGESADVMGASAYTVGRHIVLGAGQYAPKSQAGRQLLAHELAHTVQQSESLSSTQAPESALESQADVASNNVLNGSRVPALSAAPLSVQRQNKPGEGRLQVVANETYVFSTRRSLMREDPPTVDDARALLVKIPIVDAEGMAECEVTNVPAGWSFAHPAVGQFATVTIFSLLVGGATKYGLQGGASRVVRVRSGGAGAGKGGTAAAKPDGTQTTDSNQEKPPDGGNESAKPPTLSPEQRQRIDELRKLLPGGSPTQEDPAELLRLYQVLLDAIEDPAFSKGKGEPLINFAKFLAKNRDKIEGMLRGGQEGQLTQAKIEKIIAEYGTYIASQPAEEPKELEKVEDYNKLLEYNPNWQKMSPADRKLLLDYAKMTPDELEKAPIDFTAVTTDMKIGMALKLSKSWPGEVLEAAKNAFSDPAFVIMLIVTIGIYVGLWLTPDPTWVTKIAAGTLTAVMLTQFAWQDIYGTAKAWFDLEDACKKAKTVKELEEAGNVFARQVGAVGFDILLFVAMWGLGKLAGPKLSKIGAQRGVARAEASVKAVEAKPGSGVAKKLGTPEATAHATEALKNAARPTASATLDAFADTLPEGAARQGLNGLRDKIGDLQALKALKSELAKGNDISRFLSEKAQTPEVRAKVQAELLKAKVKLARAKLIEADTIKDPALRESARSEQINSIKEILQKAGILNDPKVAKAMKAGDVSKLVGEIGEAIQRTQMRAKYPASEGYTVMSNVEVVQEVPGFRSIKAWQAAEKAAGREGNVGGLYEAGNKLWKSLGEADSLAAKEGTGGKLRPVEIQEVKTGETEKASTATRQLAKLTTGFQQIAAGQGDIRIFDRVGKNQLGGDITERFDLSQLDKLKTSTLGPEGKTGFDQSLGFDTATLNAVAESLIKNLPPATLPVIPPMVSPRDQEKKKEKENEEDAVPAGR